MDLATLRRLSKTFHPRILVALGNATFLKARGVTGVEDMDWWQSVEVARGITVTGTPAKHYSARWITDRWRTLWMGFVIQGSSGSVYFAGDTGFGDFFQQVKDRFHRFSIVILPIAPGLPIEAMGPQHMSAADAVKAYQVLGAPAAIGMHYGTFQQGDEQWDQSVALLHQAIAAAKDCRIVFWALRNGEAVEIPSVRSGVKSCE
jgi:L-ascorbate metabolism protein UlaG (beta-lactamase superfamily)